VSLLTVRASGMAKSMTSWPWDFKASSTMRMPRWTGGWGMTMVSHLINPKRRGRPVTLSTCSERHSISIHFGSRNHGSASSIVVTKNLKSEIE
jgi:hypothetical protein